MKVTYIVFIIQTIIGYFLCYLIATENESRRNDNVSIPKMLKKIVFPFLGRNPSLKEKKISLTAVMGGIYSEVSFLGISVVYFLTKNHIKWDWQYVNGVWAAIFLLLPTVSMGVSGISEFKNAFTIGEKLGAIFLLLFAVASSALGIVFIVGVMIDLGLF